MGVLAVVLVAFVFGFVGSMPLAGPVALLVFSRGVEGKLGEALRIGVGAAVAEGLYAAVAFFGFATILAHHPVLLPVAHGVTAVVLLAVGVYFLFWKKKEGVGPEAAPERVSGTFFVGFTISVLNPTLFVTWTAAVAWLYSKQLVEMSGWMALPFGAMAAVGIAAWFVVLVALIRRYKDRFPSRALTWTVRVMGLALIGLAIWSAVQLVMWIQAH